MILGIVSINTHVIKITETGQLDLTLPGLGGGAESAPPPLCFFVRRFRKSDSIKLIFVENY